MATADVYSLQNADLAVDLIPSEGGRIASLRSRLSGLEFLTQSNRTGPYPQPGLATPFQHGPCAGIEECLPTVGPGEAEGGFVPDHGDFWQLPWELLASAGDQLSLSATGFSRALRFAKHLALQSSTLEVRYRVENIGAEPQSFLYACHPLFAVSTGDRILLPPDIRALTLNYSRDHRIGERGSIVPWPVTASGIRLDVTEGPERGTAEMFYTGRLKEGVCGIWRRAADQVLEVAFDTSRLPFLGLWICYGGWPDQSDGPRQYAVALEPTTSGCNTLAEAQQMGCAVELRVGDVSEWEIRFQILTPGRDSKLLV
jgi:galactose mutarotase-like enzyme